MAHGTFWVGADGEENRITILEWETGWVSGSFNPVFSFSEGETKTQRKRGTFPNGS